MKFTFRSSRAARVVGYPDTDRVRAKRLRAKGDLLSRSGPLVLQNGTNVFTFDPTAFARISLNAEPSLTNVPCIVGVAGLDDETPTVLARFGSARAAQNGYTAMVKAVSGVASGGGSRVGSVLKWAGVACAVFVLTVVMGFLSVSSGANQAVAASQPDGPPMIAGASPDAVNHGSTAQQDLDEMAAGNYQFRPHLKAPDVQLPALKCAKPSASKQ